MSITLRYENMKDLDTVDIAEKIAKDKKLIVLLKVWSYADVDGLGSSFSILNLDEWSESLIEEIEEYTYESFQLCSYEDNDNYYEFNFGNGFRSSKIIFKFWNLPKDEVDKFMSSNPKFEHLEF